MAPRQSLDSLKQAQNHFHNLRNGMLDALS